MVAYDSGYSGLITSMSGAANKFGHGLKATQIYMAVPAALPVTLVAPANPRRLYLFLECRDLINAGCTLYMENEMMCVLYVGQSITWDREHPWTGAVYAIGYAGDSVLVGIEVELTTQARMKE